MKLKSVSNFRIGNDGSRSSLQQDQNPLREHVLFVTGDIVASRTQGVLERNRLPHLAKPFGVEHLCEALRQALWHGNGTRVVAANVEAGDHSYEG